MRNRRHVRVPPDLTSLFDVLFIVIFAALIRAAAAEKPKPPAPVPPAPVPVQLDPKSLQARAVTGIDAILRERPAVVARISAEGMLVAVEADGKTLAPGLPLLAPNPDAYSDTNVAYVGARSPDLHLCRIIARQLGVPDLAKHLVIVAPSVPLRELPDALTRELVPELDHCMTEDRAVATIVEPGP